MASSPIYLRRLLVRRRCIVMHIFNMGQNHGIDHFFLLVIVSTPSLQKSTFFSFCKISFGISQTYTVNVRGIHLIFSLLWGNEVANDSTVFEIRTNQTPPPFLNWPRVRRARFSATFSLCHPRPTCLSHAICAMGSQGLASGRIPDPGLTSVPLGLVSRVGRSGQFRKRHSSSSSTGREC